MVHTSSSHHLSRERNVPADRDSEELAAILNQFSASSNAPEFANRPSRGTAARTSSRSGAPAADHSYRAFAENGAAIFRQSNELSLSDLVDSSTSMASTFSPQLSRERNAHADRDLEELAAIRAELDAELQLGSNSAPDSDHRPSRGTAAGTSFRSSARSDPSYRAFGEHGALIFGQSNEPTSTSLFDFSTITTSPFSPRLSRERHVPANRDLELAAIRAEFAASSNAPDPAYRPSRGTTGGTSSPYSATAAVPSYRTFAEHGAVIFRQFAEPSFTSLSSRRTAPVFTPSIMSATAATDRAFAERGAAIYRQFTQPSTNPVDNSASTRRTFSPRIWRSAALRMLGIVNRYQELARNGTLSSDRGPFSANELLGSLVSEALYSMEECDRDDVISVLCEHLLFYLAMNVDRMVLIDET